ncbi:hypothetical protein ABT403_09280 [Streptomyces sp. NPDC000075]|uniref:hypothetical protein n=1 Tax=Streptomyces TaxID=1883 RepID=UPI0031CDCDA7
MVQHPEACAVGGVGRALLGLAEGLGLGLGGEGCGGERLVDAPPLWALDYGHADIAMMLPEPPPYWVSGVRRLGCTRVLVELGQGVRLAGWVGVRARR